MAGRRLLMVFSLLILTEQFEVREDEWEELRPDIAALHRLRGLPERMSQETLKSSVNQRVDIDRNPMTLQDNLQECKKSFPDCVKQMEQDFQNFLEVIDEQKTQDWLLHASEVSHSYSQKLLVMTDKERSTDDRVQQEYSMDPYYSVIVSKECLDNVSCVPEADSYTVVKIFGSVSKDGQTVSGLSGSALAEMMLKPSLEDVPVFFIDGNTTTHFQHKFIRVFVVRGINAVLETKQENHQVYQTMNRLDSVSRYQIPQRAVDHTTQYDHQQILIMENDPVVQKAAMFLYEKHPTVSSVYVLDENRRPKLIHGDTVPLTEDSRLVLVGHGVRDNSGEMRLAGYTAQEVAKVIEQTPRVSEKIKTMSVVACEAGSDKAFVETLLKELHDAGIKSELHLRDAVVQVRHTGEKITQEISTDGLKWQHKDDSKKVVATLDRNGNVIIRNEPGSKGEAIFTNERNLLMPKKTAEAVRTYRDSWPDKPQRFIDQNVFKYMDQNKDNKAVCDELEAMSWGIFHSERTPIQKMNTNNLQEIEQHYVIGERIQPDINNEKNIEIRWLNSEQGLRNVLSKCFEIRSGTDVRNVIQHYAKTGENVPTYLMVNDWIYLIDPKSLYVFPVGKRLDNNQRGNKQMIENVKSIIESQRRNIGYDRMRQSVHSKREYAVYVQGILIDEIPTYRSLPNVAKYTTYFTASVISESIRNFRTFPLTLMALDMVQSGDNNYVEKGLDFLFEGHSMATGGSWTDENMRGFFGTAIVPEQSKAKNKDRGSRVSSLTDSNAPSTSRDKNKERLGNLKEVLEKELKLYQSWMTMNEGTESTLSTLFEKYQSAIGDPENVMKDYNTFKAQIGEPPASGTLGDYNDGHVRPKDLKSSIELENSFKHESYFSRVRALSSELIHNQMKAKYGENLAGMHLQEGSARMENGQFICTLVSEGAEPEEFRVELSPESQHYNEKLLKGIETAVHDLESHGAVPSHQVSKYVEHIGTAVGTLGLMLGMKGAVRAFEQGDVKDGVVGALQTAHGVTAMTASVIARQSLSSEARIAKAATTIMKSPAMRGAMTVIPVVGIGFGIYNLEQDLERGDTLGYIDAAFDAGMIGLDVLEIAQPELAPFIIPVNLVLSTVRMVFDDVYMGVENELKSLPKDAGVLDRLRAVTLGLGKGILHFGINVASFFYDWHYDEIEEGHRLVGQISDYHKYYKTVNKEHGRTSAIDFNSGDSSWNGGGIHFCLADQGQSELCMDYFVSSDESPTNRCWKIDAQGSKDIILGLGESHQLEHKTLQNKVLLFIPAGSETVVSGYKAVSNSRYGIYTGNKDANRFFAIQKAEDQQMTEVMLSYYYRLYGEPGDDIFFLGPQISYVQGSGGKDTYIIPKNGGKTTINNYDPSKALDTLHFSVDYSHISVSKSGDDVVLRYEGSHTVTIEGWFLGELYRHMNMISGDGVLFEISSTVISSVRLVARGINKMFEEHGARVDSSQPLLRTVTTIFGSRYDDTLIGNEEKNVIDGGGGRDHLIGAEGEDMYIVKDRQRSSVLIENHSKDLKTDVAIIEANLHTLKVSVDGDDVVLNAFHDNTATRVTLMSWFTSPEDRHLLVVTKDLVTFTISDKKADCLHGDPFTKCIKSHSIDYSKSPSRLVVDLQEDEALHSVTEVRGSDFNDVIRGNKVANVIVPGRGDDFIQGRGGEDWYVITPGQGVKTINNESPDLASDILFLKEHSRHIISTCDGQSIMIWVNSGKEVILQNWFDSKNSQHLHIRTSDGITAGFISNRSNCDTSLMLPLTVDYRNQKPEPLDSFQTHSVNVEGVFSFSVHVECFTYRSKDSTDRMFCGLQGKMMNVADVGSVKELYGSSGFDIIVGNSNENLLDPHTGGAVMFGGEGKDTYIIKHGYGNKLMIDNFAEDLSIDTVLVDMDFLSGSRIALDSSARDLNVTIATKEDLLVISLLDYNNGYRHQHLEFQSSDGVNFKLKSLNSTGDVPLFDVEAFKVTLKQSQVDCHLDLNSQRNLSKVHTVQGCPSLSNGILGNDQDNALVGGWRDDVLEGGEGDDTLMGGNGDDILTGDLGDDTLYGDDGNDTMMGNSGQDVFIPGPGADLVDGGPGRDTVLYRGDHDTGKGVYVNLITGQGRYADAEGDVLKDVETVIGTIYSDILVAGYESSLLKGSDGSDILVSTGGDYLVGGEGNDIYVLAFHDSSVTINNCAKDNAMDVLYLSSRTVPIYDCQLLSDRLLLTFYGPNQSAVKLVLEGWTSDHHACGHLKVVFRDMELSVGWMVAGCQEKRAN
ncbi:hypothetical protein GBF38_000276 [Nibea albiflora]|nr:hypothetical protein GBF38_000276 [Nibea albiflora]